MMKFCVSLDDIQQADFASVGGKAYSLAYLAQHGFQIAEMLCVTTGAYQTYLAETGLQERILLELNRKLFEDMRWEEIWDCALRIRNMFMQTPIPEALRVLLQQAIHNAFGDNAVVVRSSAPSEDAAGTSFAGLHESYVNVCGVDDILEHIKLVWASLWSDAAISYRRELGLDVQTSAMAVVIQKIVHGECSGVAFSQSPTEPSQAMIESVYGLNQGLVDGVIEPDRWIFDRATRRMLLHTAVQREHYMCPARQGIHLQPLPAELAQRPPLTEQGAQQVFTLAQQAEHLYGKPQDVEWTFKEKRLYTLQSRPITTISTPTPQDDRRQWDLSLRRSYANLRLLRKKIEEQHLPAMISEAETLVQQPIMELSDSALAREIDRRIEIFQTWNSVYWTDFIPFAHGIRLFGQVYNDAVRPDDPYEFVQLLQATNLQSLERNRMLNELAAMLRADCALVRLMTENKMPDKESDFMQALEEFIAKFGDLAHHSLRRTQTSREHDMLLKILLNMAAAPSVSMQIHAIRTETLKKRYLLVFNSGEARAEALDMLELGRVSYQLRDDDNIYLGRIEDEVERAACEGRRRLAARGRQLSESFAAQEISHALKDPSYQPQAQPEHHEEEEQSDFIMKGRQLIGQPAGPGLARGTARLILGAADLAKFQYGEILVCDAIDPTMTFIVPLAAGVIERRGGMLIHGAIIAREYGLPCVTGVPDAMRQIQSGDHVTVDGFLGIVTLG